MPLHDFKKYRLMAPGPVPMSAKVREALNLPMVHHRTPEFEAIFKEALEGLQWIFQTAQPVLILSSTGTGGMEAAIINTLSPGDEVLAVVSGKFAERWKKIAEIYGIKVDAFDVPWGEAPDLQKFEEQLKKKTYKAVLTQVCETSTATLNPIQDMVKIHRQLQGEGLFMIDAISAIGCTELPMDEWGIDVVVAGSQKAFALPTGLSFVALSKKAWDFNSTARCPRFYLDLKKELDANKKGETHFSSSVLLIRALNAALSEFRAQGFKRLLETAEKRARATREGVKVLGLKVYSQSPSPSVTAVVVPKDIDKAKLRGHIEKNYRLTLMGGQDHLKGKILRFGHMGDISSEDILASLEALALSLKDFGFEVTDKTLAQALDVAKGILA